MPIRYPCPAHEAGEECEHPGCMHVTELDHETGAMEEQQYLFGTLRARILFDSLPAIVQQLLLHVCDAEYHEGMFLDD